MYEPARKYGVLAGSLLTSDEDIQNALDGYDLFFDVFIRENPAKYISFTSFVYKQFCAEERLKTPVVFARKDGRPVAMQWYMPVTVRYRGAAYPAAHAADTCALPEGRGLTFLKMFGTAERAQKYDGVALRFGTPNENSMKFVKKFGAEVLGVVQNMVWESHNRAALSRLNENAAASELGLSISMHDRCPFDEADLTAINDANYDYAWPERTRALFTQRLDDYPWGHPCYVTARSVDGSLRGYLAANQTSQGRASIYDWDLLGAKDEVAVLAQMLQALTARFNHLSVEMVNAALGDAALLEACGFRTLVDADGTVSGSNFAWVPYQEGLPAAFSDLATWKTRSITEDWILNAYQAF